jgi:hypothetical protein
MKPKKCPECIKYWDMWNRSEANLQDPEGHIARLEAALDFKDQELKKLKENYNWVCERLTLLENIKSNI